MKMSAMKLSLCAAGLHWCTRAAKSAQAERSEWKGDRV
jgi:hypothetical protein